MSGNFRLRATSLFLWLLFIGSAHATTFTLTINEIGSGSVSRNPTNSKGIYPAGATVTLTSVSNDPSWYFSSWSGDATGSDNPLNVGMDSNKVITATFLQLPAYTLTLATNGQGTISLNPSGGVYLSNSIVTATATAATGWVFVAWSGSTNGNANPLSIAMNTDFSLTGTFAQLPAFDTQPAGVTNVAGSTVSFTSHAVGNTPLGYQWFFSGGLINNATNTTLTTLTLMNLQSVNAGNYWIIATNNYGSATSSVVALVITNSIGTTNVVNSPDEASLRAAIKIGGWVSLRFNGTVTITDTINITNNVILDGSSVSATISGGNAVRLFYVAPGASFSATNLTLANGLVLGNGSSTLTNGVGTGTPADAGAIYNDHGAVTLTACTVTKNSAKALYVGGVARGGAIFNNGGNLALFQTAMSNNAAIGGGTDGAASLNGTDLGLGGAIYNTNGTVVMMGCNISSNLCQGLNAITTAYNIVFNNGFPMPPILQTASGNGISMGGGVDQASGSLTITTSRLSFNLALGSQGAPFGLNYTLANGSPAYGGALAVTGGNVPIDHSQFFGNTATGGDAGYHNTAGPAFGGAIYSAAALSIKDSSVFGNGAFAGNNTVVPIAATKGTDGFGGAIYNLGTAVLDRCSVYSNYVQGGNVIGYGPSGSSGNGGNGLGGGVFNAAQLAATNCTIALNSATGGGAGSGQGAYAFGGGNALGGGVFNNINATVAAMNITIASNACSSPFLSGYFVITNGLAAGSQIANSNGMLRLHNSIIAYGGTNGNSFGVITDDGFNISSDGSANLFGGASYNYTDPKLGPLDYYTGPTPCMALLPNSPAIDFGDSSGVPATDQRGYPRPNGSGVDIGAYEFYYPTQAVLVARLNMAPAANGIGLNFTAFPINTYRLQASTNLLTWFDLETNGPFASVTNVNRTYRPPGPDHRFFRLLLQ
jgi:hypothetical protein